GSSSVPKELIDIINEYGGEIPETYGVPIEDIQEGIRQRVRKINVDTDFKFDINVNKNGLMVTGAVTVKASSGEALFDPQRGHIHSRRQKLTLEGDFEITANDETRSVQQTQVQQVNVDFLAEFP
ncbi:MAG: hypothetical protein ABGZ17_10805, partial [Planctomycetaceae bacterium]